VGATETGGVRAQIKKGGIDGSEKCAIISGFMSTYPLLSQIDEKIKNKSWEKPKKLGMIEFLDYFLGG
jgi:hypothetical protein